MLAPAEPPAWSVLPLEQRETALPTRWAAKEPWFKAVTLQACARDFRTFWHVALA